MIPNNNDALNFNSTIGFAGHSTSGARQNLKNFKNEKELESEGNLTQNSHMLEGLHIEYLKNYLNENSSINSNEARIKLHKETGLDVSISDMQKALKNLRENINSEGAEKSLPSLDSKTRIRPWGRPSKIKYLHIECLRKYLNENSSITCVEAHNRLCKETDLNASEATTRLAMRKLKEQINSDNAEIYPPSSYSKFETRVLGRPTKVKALHIECLKKYLNENSSISSAKALDKLREETGLEVGLSVVQKALKNIRMQASSNSVELNLTTKESKTRSRGTKHGNTKLKDSHIECLKKYLNENSYIGSTEARNRLQKETGLNVGISTIQKALYKLTNEIDNDGIELSLSGSIGTTRNISSKTYQKLQDSHIECLERYLNENIFIRISEAMDRLHYETGLKASYSTIRRDLVKLRKEIDPEKAKILSSSVSKNKPRTGYGSCKLEDLHIKCLKKYLSKNSSISISDARYKLNDETGLLPNYEAIRSAIANLRKETDA